MLKQNSCVRNLIKEIPQTLLALQCEVPAITAGLVIVRLDESNQPLFLSLKANDGSVSFPGGMADVGETLLETAIRESHEEVIGIDDLSFPWGKEYKTTVCYSQNPKKKAYYFIAQTFSQETWLAFNFEKEKSEHQACNWQNYEDTKQKLRKRVLPVLNWAYKRICQQPS